MRLLSSSYASVKNVFIHNLLKLIILKQTKIIRYVKVGFYGIIIHVLHHVVGHC
jgi:hypothetical protein